MPYTPDEFDQTLLSLEQGDVLSDRYRLVRELGRGGMGVVWLAEDEQLDDRSVAIKVLPSALCRNARAVARLKKEALTNLELTHQHIVRLFNFEQDPQRSAVADLVMQYVEGKTLDDLLAEHPDGLPLERVQKWAEQLAQAIDHAHSKNILHRDIKPSNIIIDGDDNAYLMDFGIAREAKDTMTRVTGRDSSGTLPYMSPQQLRGENSRSNDIYSFVATLYELLNGDPPFSSGDLQYQILNVEPKPIDNLPGAVSDAMLAGLAKTAEERPESASGLVSQLQARTIRPSPGASEHNRGDAFVKSAVSRQTPIFRWLAAILVVALLGLGVTFVIVSDGESSHFVPVTNGKQAAEIAPPNVSTESIRSRTESQHEVVLPEQRTSFVEEQMQAIRDLRASPDDRVQAIMRLYEHDPERFDWKTLHDELVPDYVPRKVIDLGDGVEMAFIYIGPGTFTMGGESTPEETHRTFGGNFDWYRREYPTRQVTISRGFWLAETPTTQAQWKRIMDTNVRQQRDKADTRWPLLGEGASYPMYFINWNESREFAERMRQAGVIGTDQRFRLPTEAEWEYACRAGTRTHYSFGDDQSQLGEYAWFDGNSISSTLPVRGRKPNPWGLYDMHGNVWEWVADWYGEYEAGAVTDPTGPRAGSLRILRGGSWNRNPRNLRSAYRLRYAPDSGSLIDGVRLALDSN